MILIPLHNIYLNCCCKIGPYHMHQIVLYQPIQKMINSFELFDYIIYLKEIQEDIFDSIKLQFNSKQSFISAVSFCIETRSCCQLRFDLCEVWNNRTFFLFHLRSKNPINKFAYQKCLFSTHTEATHKACLPCNVVF